MISNSNQISVNSDETIYNYWWEVCAGAAGAADSRDIHGPVIVISERIYWEPPSSKLSFDLDFTRKEAKFTACHRGIR